MPSCLDEFRYYPLGDLFLRRMMSANSVKIVAAPTTKAIQGPYPLRRWYVSISPNITTKNVSDTNLKAKILSLPITVIAAKTIAQTRVVTRVTSKKTSKLTFFSFCVGHALIDSVDDNLVLSCDWAKCCDECKGWWLWVRELPVKKLSYTPWVLLDSLSKPILSFHCLKPHVSLQIMKMQQASRGTKSWWWMLTKTQIY